MAKNSTDNSIAAARESVSGCLIINADDWGRNRDTTDRIFECTCRKTVSSVSAMVFMEDSERSAEIARKSGIDAGLHLNLTTPFTAPDCSPALIDQQHRIAEYFRRYHPLARVVYHPGLARAFKDVVGAQIDEFRRIYGTDPARIDGHHHVHLSSNVVFGGLFPPGRSSGETFHSSQARKAGTTALFRNFVDGVVARNHRVTDFFFSIDPIDEPGRLQRIFSLAQHPSSKLKHIPMYQRSIDFFAGLKYFN